MGEQDSRYMAILIPDDYPIDGETIETLLHGNHGRMKVDIYRGNFNRILLDMGLFNEFSIPTTRQPL